LEKPPYPSTRLLTKDSIVNVEQQTFIQIIKHTPLVSIDLVLQNESGEILLGLRRNRPAQNYWFVPGGRIQKDECIQNALARIARGELGIITGKGRLLGAFDHLYNENYFSLPDMSTHYVVLAYALEVSSATCFKGDDQHTEFKWWGKSELLANPQLHENTKLYFRTSTDNGFRAMPL
jgi:colanic acid biosynthesis protein WcaH